MRFKDLKFEIKHDSILNLESIKIPTMLFQPYVENAILHGLSHSNKDKKLEIKFEWEASNLLTATIWDNGIGRIKSAEITRQIHLAVMLVDIINFLFVGWYGSFVNNVNHIKNGSFGFVYHNKQPVAVPD
mgnify:CR=1 FL=1